MIAPAKAVFIGLPNQHLEIEVTRRGVGIHANMVTPAAALSRQCARKVQQFLLVLDTDRLDRLSWQPLLVQALDDDANGFVRPGIEWLPAVA